MHVGDGFPSLIQTEPCDRSLKTCFCLNTPGRTRPVFLRASREQEGSCKLTANCSQPISSQTSHLTLSHTVNKHLSQDLELFPQTNPTEEGRYPNSSDSFRPCTSFRLSGQGWNCKSRDTLGCRKHSGRTKIQGNEKEFNFLSLECFPNVQ